MSIDRKFKILACSKASGSIYTDENALLLCAKDAAAVPTLETYLAESKKLGADENQLKSVELLIERVKAFQSENGTKVADVSEREKSALLAE